MPNTPQESKAELTLLNSAERLFARDGYHGTSVGAITKEAGVPRASISYYFGGKLKLYSATILRRALDICDARASALRKIMAAGIQGESGLEQILDAFIDPLHERCTGPDQGWVDYCRLVANPSARSSDLLHIYDPTAFKFIDSIKILYPDISDDCAQYCFQFIVSATVYTFGQTERIDQLSEGRLKSSDLSANIEQLKFFLIGGLVKLIDENTASASKI